MKYFSQMGKPPTLISASPTKRVFWVPPDPPLPYFYFTFYLLLVVCSNLQNLPPPRKGFLRPPHTHFHNTAGNMFLHTIRGFRKHLDDRDCQLFLHEIRYHCNPVDKGKVCCICTYTDKYNIFMHNILETLRGAQQFIKRSYILPHRPTPLPKNSKSLSPTTPFLKFRV